MNGFGSVEIESDEPTFHEHREAIVFAPNIFGITALRTYNVDEYRPAFRLPHRNCRQTDRLMNSELRLR